MKLTDFILKGVRLLRIESVTGRNREPNDRRFHPKFKALAGYLLVDTCSAGRGPRLSLLLYRRDRFCARKRPDSISPSSGSISGQ